MPDATALQAVIDDLRKELSHARIQAEVFRALYTRQVAEIGHLPAGLDDRPPAPTKPSLRAVDME